MDDGGSGSDGGASDGGGSDSGGPDSGAPDGGPPGPHVVSFPVDPARVLISDATTGDLYPSEFTYELWINFDRIIPTLTQSIFLAEGGSPTGTIRLWITSGDRLEFIVRGPGGGGYLRAQVDSASTMVTTGVWHHIACTGDGVGRIALFYDGVELASDFNSSGYTMPGAGQELALGSGPHTPPPTTWRFNGLIDEFRVSNRRMYFGTFTPSRRLSVETSTVALYHFDEGAGTSAMDEVGPGLHAATLDMGATWAPE